MSRFARCRGEVAVRWDERSALVGGGRWRGGARPATVLWARAWPGVGEGREPRRRRSVRARISREGVRGSAVGRFPRLRARRSRPTSTAVVTAESGCPLRRIAPCRGEVEVWWDERSALVGGGRGRGGARTALVLWVRAWPGVEQRRGPRRRRSFRARISREGVRVLDVGRFPRLRAPRSRPTWSAAVTASSACPLRRIPLSTPEQLYLPMITPHVKTLVPSLNSHYLQVLLR